MLRHADEIATRLAGDLLNRRSYSRCAALYRAAMQEVADRVGLPVVRVSKQASVIRSKRAAVYEPRPDDDWSSLM
jgi:hypothetical protein